jgi:malate/lactate dehydrogenase
VLGRQGIVRTIECPFNDEEKRGLESSATELKKVIMEAEQEEANPQ